MIRRDYILRMIEEFIRALSRIRASKQNEAWNQAAGDLDAEFIRLIGCDLQAALKLAGAELFVRIARGEPTQAVRDKVLMLATLFKEAGDVAVAQDQVAQGREFYIKALHLVLETLSAGEVFEVPEFVPKVELLKQCLGEASLPAATRLMLMEHYERNDEFGQAENELYAIADAEPANESLAGFGLAFYERLLARTDSALEAGGLPRIEVEDGLREFRRRFADKSMC